MAELPKGKWCACGFPHETGGPCWECRMREMDAAINRLGQAVENEVPTVSFSPSTKEDSK